MRGCACPLFPCGELRWRACCSQPPSLPTTCHSYSSLLSSYSHLHPSFLAARSQTQIPKPSFCFCYSGDLTPGMGWAPRWIVTCTPQFMRIGVLMNFFSFEPICGGGWVKNLICIFDLTIYIIVLVHKFYHFFYENLLISFRQNINHILF